MNAPGIGIATAALNALVAARHAQVGQTLYDGNTRYHLL
jgi:hypothetical protein